MSGLLDGKSIIVIGADQIGAGIARRLALEGAHLAVLDEQDPRSIGAAVNSAATRLGGVYALINNLLPMPALAPLERQTSAMFGEAFARVEAAVCAMQAAMPFMRDAGQGRIVNIGHRYGDSVNEGVAAYNAAAWALVGVTRTAALEWGRHQIATNLLLPLADTTELQRAHAKRPNIINLMLSQIPLQRAGDCVEDIGGAALFLMSDAANFINGEVLYADGGQHIAGPVLNPIRFQHE
jgi:NAD(P)-dependent dehydrogenase (short-subunit alcohol dehydrogenase family)